MSVLPLMLTTCFICATESRFLYHSAHFHISPEYLVEAHGKKNLTSSTNFLCAQGP